MLEQGNQMVPEEIEHFFEVLRFSFEHFLQTATFGQTGFEVVAETAHVSSDTDLARHAMFALPQETGLLGLHLRRLTVDLFKN
jgi:hypothetical protein